jgi:hypothetical protein
MHETVLIGRTPAPNRACRFFIIANPCYWAPKNPSNHIFNGADTGFDMRLAAARPTTPRFTQQLKTRFTSWDRAAISADPAISFFENWFHMPKFKSQVVEIKRINLCHMSYIRP